MERVRTFLRWAFLTSEEDPRLRAGWRLMGFLLLNVVVSLALGYFVLLVYDREPPPWSRSLISGEAWLALQITLTTWIARRWLDRRSFGSLGLPLDREALRELLFGVGVTALIMGLIFIVEAAAGWLRVQGFLWQRQTWGAVLRLCGQALIFWALVAWSEELFFRGYLLINLRDGLGTRWAVILSSVLFAAAHYRNPHMNWAALVGLILAGFFLADGWLTTRRLWLPLGLHLGWNLFEGTVLGFPVSGLPLDSLIQIQVQGPPLITGGAFGPEAGLVVVPALALGAWMMHRWAARRAL